jgi:PIN domain nuclease of toxin-antitoxin system
VKLLLDTCTFLWIITGDASLSPSARKLFSDPANEVFLSSVSAWEIALKHGLGKLPLPRPPHDLVPDERQRHEIQPLPLDEAAALFSAKLPDLHKDPFDRMADLPSRHRQPDPAHARSADQAVPGGHGLVTTYQGVQSVSRRGCWNARIGAISRGDLFVRASARSLGR